MKGTDMKTKLVKLLLLLVGCGALVAGCATNGDVGAGSPGRSDDMGAGSISRSNPFGLSGGSGMTQGR